MKRLLFIMVMSVGFIYAQETPIQEKPVKAKKGYRTHSIAISQRLGGFAETKNTMGGAQGAAGMEVEGYSEYLHYGNYTTVFEFFTEKRKGHSQYTPMIGIRLSTAFSPNDGLYGGFRWGVIFGGSQYLFDMRSKETGLGWSMLANGGFILDFPTIEEMKSLKYPGLIGGEVDFKVIYNVHKHVGVTFGLNMGYMFSLDISEVQKPDGSYQVIHNNGFAWNLNFGVIF